MVLEDSASRVMFLPVKVLAKSAFHHRDRGPSGESTASGHWCRTKGRSVDDSQRGGEVKSVIQHPDQEGLSHCWPEIGRKVPAHPAWPPFDQGSFLLMIGLDMYNTMHRTHLGT